LESKSVSDPNLAQMLFSAAHLKARSRQAAAGSGWAAGARLRKNRAAADCLERRGDCLERGRQASPRERVGGRQRSRVVSDGRPSDSASKHRAPAALLLPWALCVGLLHGPKLKTCSLETWVTTRAMAWAALVLGPPLATSRII